MRTSRTLVTLLAIASACSVGRAAPAAARDDPRAERAVRDVMAMSERELVAIVPDQCPDVEAPCPKCRLYLRTVRKGWAWSPTKPHQVRCPVCGTVYPDPNYPMDRKATFLNFLGEKVTVPYHLGPRPKGDYRGNRHPERHFFEAAVDNQQYRWVAGRALPRLAAAWQATGKDVYARRAALLLDALARRYKHYLLHRGRGVNGYYVSTGGPCMVDGRRNGTPGRDLPYGWTDGRLMKCWISEIDLRLVNAYAAIKDRPALRKLSGEMGVDVARRIENDLLREMVDFTMLVPWPYHMDNNLVGYFAWIARVGEAVGEPEYAHTAYRYLSTVIQGYGRKRGAGYTFDLHHPEGNQGHYGVMRGIYGIYKAIEGYSDPPGYRGRHDAVHLEDVSLKRDLPLFERMIYAPAACTLPNGNMNPLNDTIGPKGELGRQGVEMIFPPLKESRCRMLPGLGHVVLGDGRGRRQVQVQLQFSEQGANHAHRDALSLVWYAHGREMTGDIGYQRNKLREWAASALSHNTVVIDRADQNGGDTFGNVRLYVPGLPGLAVVQVDAAKAYRKLGATLYRRTIVLNTAHLDAPYFVDVFEVEGGATHDYAMHGSVYGDMTGGCSLPMKPMPGEHPLLEKGETWTEPGGLNREFAFPSSLYGLFRNVRRARASRDFTVTFTPGDDPSVGTRIHVPRDETMEVFLGETPALRKAGHYRDKHVYNWWMPHLVARRRGPRGLRSVFVAVYDLFQGGPKIASVRRLAAGEGVVALAIETNGRTDTLLYSPDAVRAMRAGGVRMRGRLGLVSRKGDRADAWLIGSTELVVGDRRLTAPAAFHEGVVTAATRRYDGAASDAFVTPAELPAGTAPRGSWLVLTHAGGRVTHAYEIDRVERQAGRTWIHLTHDHGLRMAQGATKEVFSPWRTFRGEERFAIAAAAAAAATAATPVVEPTSGPWSLLDMQRFVPFVDRITVTLRAPPGREIRYTTDGAEPSARSTRYGGPFVLTSSATVKAVVPDPAGVQRPRAAEQAFQAACEPVAPAGVQPGLAYRYLAGGKVTARGVTGRIGPVPGGRRRADLLELRGLLRVPRTGVYTFSTRADAGCTLRVAGLDLIDTMTFRHWREFDAKIALKAGLHPLELTHSCRGRSQPVLQVRLAGPGLAEQLVPPEALSHAGGSGAHK